MTSFTAFSANTKHFCLQRIQHIPPAAKVEKMFKMVEIFIFDEKPILATLDSLIFHVYILKFGETVEFGQHIVTSDEDCEIG